MTDNEIIKALEDLLELLLHEGDLQRTSIISKALDLIKRKDAEIERLQTNEQIATAVIAESSAEIERVKKESNEWSRRFINRCRDFEFEIQENKKLKAEIERLNIELQSMRSAANSYKMHYETAKSEAIKEFAERLTDKADLIKVNPFDSKWAISQDNIDNLVKEMTE